MTKIQDLQGKLEQNGIAAAVIADPVTLNYLTGYYSDPHERHMYLFLISGHEPLLFLPELDALRASQTVPFPVVGYVDSENPWEKIKATLPQTNFAKVAVEFDYLNVTKFKGLESIFSAEFVDLTPTINLMRLIKSADEIEKLHFAGDLADKAVQIGFKAISSDKTETDIIAEIEFEMKRMGYAMSFETMVLTGTNAANPHGIPGANKIEPNQLLLFDLGIDANGYMSDMTRTVAVGQPDDFSKEIYAICLEAQLAASDFIKPGVTAAEVDAVARGIITKAGYGEYFNHRLGHGIGMGLHEFPSIMAGNDMVLQEGMCFSVEPGIYVPGKAGVRIEDCGVVTKDGFEVFTHTPKELLYF
ncbi:M24 family metallopeptidase [Streptococcus caprae]|uniref:M24 family metallopeptidase n=1 Tax=Streptococcus caprae TaxID=1640501 RepID=A0ABV8CU56_9STRE